MSITFHCPHRGCPNRMPCATHKRKNPYTSARWRKERRFFLGANPLCVRCLEKGIVRASVVKDHIKPVNGIDDPSFWIGPFQALCFEHHREKTWEDRRNE